MFNSYVKLPEAIISSGWNRQKSTPHPPHGHFLKYRGEQVWDTPWALKMKVPLVEDVTREGPHLRS